MRAVRLLAAVILLAVLPAFGAPPAAPVDSPAIPFKQDSGELGALMWRSFLVMAGLVVCAAGTLWILRRYGVAPRAGGTATSVRIVDTLRVGPRASLLVVQFGAQRILVAHGERGMRVLARERAPGEPAE